MIIALNSDNIRVSGSEASVEEEYYCQQCGQRVIPKKGHIKIHHFAHYPGSPSCVWWEPESETHLRMKVVSMELLKKGNSVHYADFEHKIEYQHEKSLYDWTFEYDSDSLRDMLSCDSCVLFPDVYLELNNGYKIAVECQKSNKSITDFIAKTMLYSYLNIYTLWIFDAEDFTEDSRLFHGDECFLPTIIMRQLHTWNFGRIYTIDLSKKFIFGNHFHGVYRAIAPVNHNISHPSTGICPMCSKFKSLSCLHPKKNHIPICGDCYRYESCYTPPLGSCITDYKPKTPALLEHIAINKYSLLCVEVNGFKIARFYDRKWW